MKGTVEEKKEKTERKNKTILPTRRRSGEGKEREIL
jgi:hypothetical protein